MTIQVLLSNVLTLINTYIIPLLVALAIVYFFLGIIKYIQGGGDGKADGMKIMGAGIIGLVVMLSVWGIVTLVTNSLGVGGQQTITLPQIH